jgi:hypothetical protein
MKMIGFIVSLLFCSISISAYAGWQVASPAAAAPQDPFFQAGTPRQSIAVPTSYSGKGMPSQYANLGPQLSAMYAVSISGSLKENLERIMSRYHWRVVWKSPNDYNFDGRVTGSSLPNVLGKLLQPFPLQAVMYMSNRTIAIVPRYTA